MRARFRVGFAALALVAVCGAGRSWSAGSRADLDHLRNRLRADAGASGRPAGNEDLPMVTVTVLPGDTHARLARELAGTLEAEPVLRKIEPVLSPGEQLYVPRTILSPALADPGSEVRTLGGAAPTLWSLTKEATGAEGADLGRAVRNLQRLNGIPDPSKLSPGAQIRVPRSLLAGVTAPLPEPNSAPKAASGTALVAAPSPALPPATEQAAAGEPRAPETPQQPAGEFKILETYRATAVDGLDRRVCRFPKRLQTFLGAEEFKKCASGRGGDVDLVVVHTTEHRGGSFDNTASYIRRKRLANYLIGPDGAVYAVVPEEYRAYGCGDSLWEGRYGVDLESINIEIFANTAPSEYKAPITEAQYQGLKGLLADIRSRRPVIHEGRIVTHRMVALSYRSGSRSRKGDPYEFDWAAAGLPDNSQLLDQDVLLGRAKLCTDDRYTDRVTAGQTAAAAARTSSL